MNDIINSTDYIPFLSDNFTSPVSSDVEPEILMLQRLTQHWTSNPWADAYEARSYEKPISRYSTSLYDIPSEADNKKDYMSSPIDTNIIDFETYSNDLKPIIIKLDTESPKFTEKIKEKVRERRELRFKRNKMFMDLLKENGVCALGANISQLKEYPATENEEINQSLSSKPSDFIELLGVNNDSPLVISNEHMEGFFFCIHDINKCPQYKDIYKKAKNEPVMSDINSTVIWDKNSSFLGLQNIHCKSELSLKQSEIVNLAELHKSPKNLCSSLKGNASFQSYFDNKKRLWEVRFQMRFKQCIPMQSIFVGVCIDNYVPVRFPTSNLISWIMALLRKVVSKDLYCSVGQPNSSSSKAERPHVVGPLIALDYIHITKPGEYIPSIVAIDLPKSGYRRSDCSTTFREFVNNHDTSPDNIYTFSLWGLSQYMSALNWCVSGITPRQIDVTNFVAKEVVHWAMYTRTKDEEKHFEENKDYIFDIIIWNAQKEVNKTFLQKYDLVPKTLKLVSDNEKLSNR